MLLKFFCFSVIFHSVFFLFSKLILFEICISFQASLTPDVGHTVGHGAKVKTLESDTLAINLVKYVQALNIVRNWTWNIHNFLILGWCPRPLGRGVLFRSQIRPLFRAPLIFEVSSKIFDATVFVFVLFCRNQSVNMYKISPL